MVEQALHASVKTFGCSSRVLYCEVAHSKLNEWKLYINYKHDRWSSKAVKYWCWISYGDSGWCIRKALQSFAELRLLSLMTVLWSKIRSPKKKCLRQHASFLSFSMDIKLAANAFLQATKHLKFFWSGEEISSLKKVISTIFEVSTRIALNVNCDLNDQEMNQQAVRRHLGRENAQLSLEESHRRECHGAQMTLKRSCITFSLCYRTISTTWFVLSRGASALSCRKQKCNGCSQQVSSECIVISFVSFLRR